MYGDDDDSGSEDSRPLSFIASKYGGERLDKAHRPDEPDEPDEDRLRLVRTTSDRTRSAAAGSATAAGPAGEEANGVNGAPGNKKSRTSPAGPAAEQTSPSDTSESPLPPPSPTASLRDVQPGTPTSQFPLTNIDNPNDIAQELSNLQALRRMSMDVGNTTDPDLLQFSGVSLMEMPPIAPTGDDDEADPSRLLWVPARVHPELEPSAFKNFLEKRVQTIKRRSGESFLSVDGTQGSNAGGLRRKKSMLSRQVNASSENGDDYVDGAEKLARKRSAAERGAAELSLSDLVNDPAKAVQKLTQEARQENGEGDTPILPVAPGMGLRRSTKTAYRKGGSQRYGDRAPFAKRLAARQAEKDNADEAPAVPSVDASVGKPLTRTMSEPTSENYSRPNRTVRRQQNFSREAPAATASATAASDGPAKDETAAPGTQSSPPSTETLPVRPRSKTGSEAPSPPIPQIVETPPTDETPQPGQSFPQKSSSQKAASQRTLPEQPSLDEPPARSSKRLAPGRPQPAAAASALPSTVKEHASRGDKALGEISQPQALPGSGSTTTSSLTIIPTFDSIERKFDRRSKDKDDGDSVASHKSSSSWKWFKSEDKERKKREKEKEKEKEREEQAKKARAKTGEKGHDNARLDVLQNSIEIPKGRESLRLDRESVESLVQEERKRESNRKSSESKKEKEGFFGGLFGGSKRKAEKEASHKKKEPRPPTPEPPPRLLRPDIDYHWTRFPIIEERAIYRMAHIKLANPRRSLLSQVLLSNFMYSYLAKVQAMHPQLQIPISPQQKRQEEERKRREAEQAQLQLEQQMVQQAAQDGSFNFEYHRVSFRSLLLVLSSVDHSN